MNDNEDRGMVIVAIGVMCLYGFAIGAFVTWLVMR